MLKILPETIFPPRCFSILSVSPCLTVATFYVPDVPVRLLSRKLPKFIKSISSLYFKVFKKIQCFLLI